MSATTGTTPGELAADQDTPGAGERPAAVRLQRRLRPLYAALLLQNVALWVPVEKLFMNEIGFDPASVGVMAAAYALVAPALEIPSGILADRWSRRGVLMLGNGALVLAVAIGGLSTNVVSYVVAAMFLGVFFAMQSGTLDAVVYDTVLEEMGDSHDFERRIGRVRLVESVALVTTALAGGWLASLTSPRLTYFMTVPFTALSLVALRAFDEPRLHKAQEATSLRRQVSVTYRTIVQRDCLLPIITLMVLTTMLLNVLFEFGALWLVALAAPAILFGPHFAGLTSAFGIGGLLAGRVRLDSPTTLAAVVGLLVVSSLTLVISHHPVVVIGSQVILAVLMVTVGIFLTAQLHGAVPSSIRSGVASGVGTFSWIAFLPFSLIFGFVSKRFGVYAAGWMVTATAVLVGVLLIRLVLARKAEAAVGPQPDHCPALAAL